MTELKNDSYFLPIRIRVPRDFTSENSKKSEKFRKIATRQKNFLDMLSDPNLTIYFLSTIFQVYLNMQQEMKGNQFMF